MTIEKQSSKLVKPFFPTPPTLRHYKIGLVDELMPFMNVGVALYFSTDSNHDAEFVTRLENSLEKTLPRFYPLAGRFVNKTLTIDCNDQGVDFIHAKVNIKLQDILAPNVNVKYVDDFIPSKKFAIDQFHEPLLTVQVTMFECGGVALGVNVSHKIVDASTLSTFVTEWAAMNRKENEIESTGPGLKHMENELAVRPLLAEMLGTDRFSIPSPNRPLGAAPSKNEPVWIIPHLQ
ncbi:transferase, Chloramphenicol acetyltransferase-like domain protein [Artemisia annua]|uniref:Transferase, Chloramphenicol acetyltransferase-like domain protein n=1 Tax=Artemisia annua TaxID=35608 RepID=A0A2U1LMU4_ARTAN|nr:transferase, Chloramphenicol acetyltransferase-like domain protein [Artemisia annua]